MTDGIQREFGCDWQSRTINGDKDVAIVSEIHVTVLQLDQRSTVSLPHISFPVGWICFFPIGRILANPTRSPVDDKRRRRVPIKLILTKINRPKIAFRV